MIQYGSGNFEVILRDEENSQDFRVILTGSINILAENPRSSSHPSSNQKGDLLPISCFYDAFKRAGYSLGEDFLVVNDVRRHKTGLFILLICTNFPFTDYEVVDFKKILCTEYQTNVVWNGNWIVFLDALMKIQMFADHEENLKHISPSRIRRLEISAPKFLALKKGIKAFFYFY